MYTPKQTINTAIDTVQNAKKAAVSFFVPHEGLQQLLNSHVDSQSKYTKEFAEHFIDTSTAVMFKMMDKEVHQAFYNKFTSTTK
jgi:hypothetical protein